MTYPPPIAPNPNTSASAVLPAHPTPSTTAPSTLTIPSTSTTTIANSTTTTTLSTTSTGAATRSQTQSTGSTGDDDGKKKKPSKRRKVNHACLYCRRSHMTCDEGRPCQRCIKREIGHLCHDERRPPKPTTPSTTTPLPAAPASLPTVSTTAAATNSASNVGIQTLVANPASIGLGEIDLSRAFGASTYSNSAWSMTAAHPSTLSAPSAAAPYLYPETLGNEFSVLTDFLETLDDGMFFSPPSVAHPSFMSPTPYNAVGPEHTNNLPTAPTSTNATTSVATSNASSSSTSTTPQADATTTTSVENILPSATKTEIFFLTAADQAAGTRDERLNRVIRSKYEAGLLKPYNYVKGYARLSRWMDRNVSQESKQQILQPLSVLRPKFRAIAQSLRDLDLVFIEEAFERMLLDYDRVFSAMGVPACLWRRTGEIYKGNREFSELVGVDGYLLREGRLCIYELMAEESAVNYWEKYGHVAFDSTQKAVLTSCVLRFKPALSSIPSRSSLSTAPLNSSLVPSSPANGLAKRGAGDDDDDDDNGGGGGGTGGGGGGKDDDGGAGGGKDGQLTQQQQQQQQQQQLPDAVMEEEGFINCCFSFTIRRDKWGIPSMIVGNFIKC